MIADINSPALRQRFQPKPKPGFVKLDYSLLDLPEWQSLPAIAVAAYVAMARKFTGFNNGEISYSARECAKRFQVSKTTAWRALKLLEWRGFVRCTSRGSFNLKTRRAKTSLWELPQCGRPAPQNEGSLVSPEYPAGFTTVPNNGFPGFTRGTLDRYRLIDSRLKKAAFRGRKDPKKEREKKEAEATLKKLA